MTEEEVKKQEKRIEKFNKLNSELSPYKRMAKHLTPEAISEDIHISVGYTYGGDTYLSCSKKGHDICSVTIDYDKELADKLIEIVSPIIFKRIKELEEKIEKI